MLVNVYATVGDVYERSGMLRLPLTLGVSGAPGGNVVLHTDGPYDWARTPAQRKADLQAAGRDTIVAFLGLTPTWGEIVIAGF